MSKKKTDIEMREIAERIKEMAKYWDKDEEKKSDPCENCKVHNDCPYWYGDEEHDALDDEEHEEENEDRKCCDGDCENCIYWDDDECCCAFDNETEDEEENEDEEEDEEEQYYRYPRCEGHEICGCSDEDCYSCKGSKEHRQTEELSKFIISVNTVLGGDMGLLVFDKSNKKDMEKLAAIFGEYAKRLY